MYCYVTWHRYGGVLSGHVRAPHHVGVIHGREGRQILQVLDLLRVINIGLVADMKRAEGIVLGEVVHRRVGYWKII